jgi:Domain of unknown function (DUF4390)
LRKNRYKLNEEYCDFLKLISVEFIMIPGIFAWFAFIFAAPQPVVNWAVGDTLKVMVEGREELLNRCLSGGIEVRYQFNLRLCRKRSAWFDDCEDIKKEIHGLQYDPVSDNYRVTIDRLGDQADPELYTYPTLEDGLARATRIDAFPLNILSEALPPLPRTNYYVGIRILSDCANSFGSSLLDISYVLTFGLVKVNRFDSGWIAFNLSPQ